MASKAAIAERTEPRVTFGTLTPRYPDRLMTLEEWEDYLHTTFPTVKDGDETIARVHTLYWADIARENQVPLDPAKKCPHGQYSALYCALCSDLQYQPGVRFTSEPQIERKGILCERCKYRC